MPTFLFIVGYPIYWLEMYGLKAREGVTSPLAVCVFMIGAFFIIRKGQKDIVFFLNQMRAWFFAQNQAGKLVAMSGGLLAFCILGCGLYASLLPPHLSQEFDALNYHLTIPRQHLILGSFAHIPWSAADLFLLPVDFALAPFWFVTQLPNKFPQFLFFIGLMTVSLSLMKNFKDNFGSWAGIFILAFLGAHGLGIQLGTAMLDIVICYLFLAFVDSFLRGAILLGVVEFTFFFWAKPFIPLQIATLFLAMLFIYFLLNKSGFKQIQWVFADGQNDINNKKYGELLKKCFVGFMLLSFFVAGPFIAKSLKYSATPLFPFSPGICNITGIDRSSTFWSSLLASSKSLLDARITYGYGWGGLDFIKHFWLVAVPDEGVNNKFDYPLGLTFLILLVPFIYFFIRSLREKRFSIIPFFIVVYWLSWWFGSQQSRFLYIPLMLMFITVSLELKNPSRVLIAALLCAVIFNAVSIVRAHKPDFGVSPKMVLRPIDQDTLRLNEVYKSGHKWEVVYLNYHDAPYAQFPVMVKTRKLPYALGFEISTETKTLR